MNTTLKTISKEMRDHAPFTMLGAATGIAIVALIYFARVPRSVSEGFFWVFHPFHVFLSALTTAAMYRLHSRGNFWSTLWIGYAGAVGIATLSDCMIPFLAEFLLDLPNRGIHFGFIEKWWLVNPLAVMGICIAYVWPKTKFPHAGHVFLSTWASLFHMTMALGEKLDVFMGLIIVIFLFLAVWVPCCTSDIVFPLVFSNDKRTRPH